MHKGSDVSLGSQDSDHRQIRNAGALHVPNSTRFCASFNTGNKSYWESYNSDLLELELEPCSRTSLGTEDNNRSRQHLHCLSLCSTSPGSSHRAGIKPNSQQGEWEMSMYGPVSLCGKTSSGSWSSCSSQDTWNYSGGELQDQGAKTLTWPLLV